MISIFLKANLQGSRLLGFWLLAFFLIGCATSASQPASPDVVAISTAAVATVYANLTLSPAPPSVTPTITPSPTPVNLFSLVSGPISPENSGQLEALRTLPSGSVQSLAFSPDGRLLASGGKVPMEATSAQVSIRDSASGEYIRALPVKIPINSYHQYYNSIKSVAFSPDGRRLAAGSDDGKVIFWDTASWDVLDTLNDRMGIYSLDFAPDGETLASGSAGTVFLWNIASGQKRYTLDIGGEAKVISVAFSPDGQTLAAVAGSQVILWKTTNWQKRQILSYSDWVASVAFSPDGRTLASGANDGTVILWDAATGARLRTLEGHSAPVWSVAFSPDGRVLASGLWDQTVILWDVVTGARLRTLEGHSAPVWSVAFSPDGLILASGSEDGTVILWGAP